jgi:tRNA nucleotidyltransferase/poly(A) polymerase
MGLEPSDYDIATSARPEEVMAAFPRTKPIGAKFGVVLVIQRGVPFEVATFRSDEAYVDGRRPSGVVFTTSREDVLRRDFTINGLLYDPLAGQVIDHVGGQADIQARVVRAIGDPHRRFEEDKLRILRAVRFGARLGYTIEPETWKAVRAMAPRIRQVSLERIRDELVRILTEGQAAHGVKLLEDSGLRREILPELEWNDGLHRALDLIPGSAEADFAVGVLLHQCGLEEVGAIVDRLRFSNRQVAHIKSLVANLERFSGIRESRTASVKRFLRIDRFGEHLELHRIRCVATDASLAEFDFVTEKLKQWSEADIRPEPLISGNDLVSMGLEPGPSFSKILKAIEDEQLEGRLSDRAGALEFVRRRFM